MLIRALSEHLSRKPRNSDIAKVIEAFLTVQVILSFFPHSYPNRNLA